MGKRLPYLALAIILAMSSCLLMGGKVRAASPIMYDGEIQFNVGRRTTFVPEDFNYSYLSKQLPYFGSIAKVYPELGGVPSAGNNTAYSSLPFFITINSPDLLYNGGSVYIGFAVAHSYGASVSQGGVAFDYSSISCKWYAGHSISSASTYGRNLDFTRKAYSGTMTEFETENLCEYNPVYIYADGLDRYDGSNFPKRVYFIGNTQFGMQYDISFLYGYGDTSNVWNKKFFFQFKIDVPSHPTLYVSQEYWDTIYLLMNDFINGTFQSTTKGISLINTFDEQTEQATVYASDMIYVCPVYAYACSSSSYPAVEEYLANINANLSAVLGGQSIPQSVLESYAALGSEARQAAEDAVRAMSVAQPTFNESDYDVFSNIDSVAMQQFSGVLSFLSLRRILPILLAALALVTIGYLFFGKK